MVLVTYATIETNDSGKFNSRIVWAQSSIEHLTWDKEGGKAYPKMGIHNGGEIPVLKTGPCDHQGRPPAVLSRADEQWVRFLLQSFSLAPLRRRTGLCPVRRRGGAFTEGLRRKSYLLLVGARESRGR